MHSARSAIVSPAIVWPAILASAVLALVVLASTSVAGAAVPEAKSRKRPPEKHAFTRPEELLRWMNGYRVHPQPNRMPVMAKAASTMGIFRDMETAGVYVGFMAGVIEANPKRAEALIAKMFPMPPEDQVAIVRAIAHSGHPAWKELLRKFAERMPARVVLIDRFVSGKLPTLARMPLDTGAAPLDMLWGKYFATGSYEPVVRMVSILKWAKDQNNLDRLTVGNMAKLTLATNASRDVALLKMLKTSMRHEAKETRAVLSEVIEAAETFELGKLRRDAMAAIEQLKVKGPASARSTAWWGQAGQTALALGCIVAGALGHVEVGIPCIIGGAASSAALKYLMPGQ
jgi:hypothetical protein